jgi:predicted nucleic acid-binding protein
VEALMSAPQRATRAALKVLFVDSSAIVALVDADDASHQPAVDAYESLVRDGYRLFTTDHALSEAYELLSMGVGPEVAREWLRDQKLAVYNVTEEDLADARQRLLDRTSGAALSFTDALSVSVMERLGVADAFAVDPAFLAEMG